jgi:hypothetical protein
MAAPILPQDVTAHLEAAIQLSNPSNSTCVSWTKRTSSSLSISLLRPCWSQVKCWESVLAGFGEQGAPEVRQRMEKWFELRNTVAHTHMPTVSLDPGERNG